MAKPLETPVVPSDAVFRLDLTGQTPREARSKGFDDLTPDVKLPAGFRAVGTRSPEAVVSAAVEMVEGRPTFALRNLAPDDTTAMLAGGRSNLKTDRLYVLAVEYRTEGEGAGHVNVREGDAWGRALGRLPKTDGKWRTVRFRLQPFRAGVESQLEFFNRTPAAANGLFLRSVEVADAGPVPAGPKGPALGARPGRLEAVCFEGQAGGRDGRDRGRQAAADVVRPVVGGGHDRRGRLRPHGGDADRALRNLEGTASVQLMSADAKIKLAAGKAYTARLSYATDGGTGLWEVRGPGAESVLNAFLFDSGGVFRDLDVTFAPDKDEEVGTFLQNHTTGADKGLTFRLYDLRPVAAVRPGDVRVGGFAAADAKPFGLRVRHFETLSKTGAGDWPAGWKGNCWHDKSVGEVAVEPVEGTPALTMRNVEGEPGLHVVTTEPAAKLRAGKRDAVRLTYRTEAKARALMTLGTDAAAVAGFGLPAAVGRWGDFEVVLAPTEDFGLTVRIANVGEAGPDGGLSIRAVEVRELK